MFEQFSMKQKMKRAALGKKTVPGITPLGTYIKSRSNASQTQKGPPSHERDVPAEEGTRAVVIVARRPRRPAGAIPAPALGGSRVEAVFQEVKCVFVGDPQANDRHLQATGAMRQGVRYMAR